MKIVHVATTISRGGAENHLYELILHQLKQGHTVIVAYLKGDGYWAELFEKKGVQVVNLNMKRYGDPWPILGLKKTIEHVQADVVHSHLRPAELYTRLALLGMQSVEMVISKHNDVPFMQVPLSSWIERWTTRRAKRIICISEAVRHYMIEKTGIPSDRLVTVRYGLEPERYIEVGDRDVNNQRRSWGDCGGTYLVGAVARMVPQKRLDLLLEGYARFLDKSGGHASRLVLVGEGPLEENLRRRAEELEIIHRIEWEGYRKDIPVVMRSLDVLVLTSQFEGFGLVLLEAMAASLPVVASRISAIPEVVEDGRSGRLFSFGDVETLADHLEFFSNSKNRKKYGQRGLGRLNQLFTPERMAAEVEAVYLSK